MSFYIAPDSKIQFFVDVPLDSDYTNTLFFSTVAQQTQYFNNRVKPNFVYQSYQRHSKGTLRVECKPETLYNVNYMRFQNTAFGSKWFYCFVVDVEYVNNNCTEVKYAIDVMQTYFFEMKWSSVFVNRMHTRTDNIGDNLVPEDLPVGDYVYYDLLKTGALGGSGKMDSFYIVLATTELKVPGGAGSFETVEGEMTGGVYQGCAYKAFDVNEVGERGLTDINVYLKLLTENNKSNAVVDIFMCPKFMFNNLKSASPSTNHFEISTIKWTNAFTDGIDSYKPRNNKVFTYPYNFLTVTNGNGQSAQLHYEYFNSDNCEFDVEGICSGNINVFCSPLNYKGLGKNWYEKLSINGYPKCSYNIDSYAQYSAGQGQLDRLGDLSSIVSTLARSDLMKTGSLGVTASANLADTAIKGMAREGYYASFPNQFKGANSGNSVLSSGYMDFTFSHTFIRPEFARIIDDYFTRFGYAINRVIKPTINNRSRYTYLQTTGMDINGEIPQFAVKQLNAIFDSGITFWVDHANVGNYAPDNIPRG